MFGNLFNAKRGGQNPSQTQDPVAPQATAQTVTTTVGVQQPSMLSPFGSPTPVIKQTIIEAPVAQSAAPQASAPAVAPVTQPPTDGVSSQGMDPSKRQNVTALSRLDSRTTTVLNHAQEETKRIKQESIEPSQLLFGLLYDGEVFKLLEEFGVNVSGVSQEIQKGEKEGSFTGQPVMSEATKKIFEDAYMIVKKRGASFITPEDVLLALFNDAQAAASLSQKGVSKEGLEGKLAKSTDYTVSKKSVLEKYGIDLTSEAKEGKLDPIVGRDRELERLVHIVLRRTKNNPIIIGEAGVGKTAIVEALAQAIVEGKVPEQLRTKRIIQLDVTSLVAGASHRGEFEERLRDVIKEVQTSGDIILFIDEIHTLIGTGDSDGALDASNIIKPFLARGQLQVIGTTTTAEYRKYFEKDKAFERRFQPVLVDEPSEEVAIEMLAALKSKYETFHDVVLTPEAVEQSVKLSKKYIGERYLPDKGVDLMDEASAQVKLERASGARQDNNVIKSDIEKVVSNWTGIPITRLTEDEGAKLLQLEDLIHKRLIDQMEAVVAVSEAVRRGRIGLAAANRPIASFIFLGPTGVGKTELAKTLAEILFGKEDAMVRLDMSEYMEKHEVAKLIGAPPGYVGYEEGGQLTEAVRKKPYSIVLLDEVEKAHPDVFNILLQLLEDGRLTDNKGNTISFKNTIIIATSNIGSALIQQELGQQLLDTAGGQTSEADQATRFSSLTKKLMDELHKFFRPELLNRFDELVMFKPLRQEDMGQIAKLGIEKTRKLLKEQNFDLQITETAVADLAKEGYDPLYGARPLRRLIQTAIENPISVKIIGKEFVPGDAILIDYNGQNGEFVFTKTQPQVTNAAGQSLPGDQVTGQVQSDNQAPSPQSPDMGAAQMPGEQNLPQVPPTPGGVAQAMPDTGLQQSGVVDPNAQMQQPAGIFEQPPMQQAPSDSMPPAPTVGSDGTQMQPA